VSAAAGGVGSIVVQLVRERGARAIGIASAHHHDWLRSVAAVPVAYGDGLAERIRAAAPSGVDAFVDTFGPEYVHLAVELGVAPARIDTIIAYEAAAEVGAKTDGSMAATSQDVLAEIADQVASGRVVVPIAATFPLDQVAQAYAQVEQRRTLGKIVLIP
jgi:NADPH2:quinone reductase